MNSIPAGAPRWPDELYESLSDGAGRVCYGLLFSERRWVHRRVETISVLSHEIARRSVSIDCTVPPAFKARLEVPGQGQSLVPLAMLPKQPLWNFDLRDEGGQAVPLLGQAANAKIAEQTLFASALEALRAKQVRDLPKSVRDALAAVVLGGTGAAIAAFEGIVAAAHRAGDSLEKKLIQDPRTALLLEAFARNYLLIAVAGDVDRRRIFKYAYDHELTSGPVRRGLAQGLGWKPLLIETAVPSAGRTASYHVEIEIPEELRLDGSFIHDERTRQVYAVDGPGDRASLHAPRVPQRARAILVFAVRPERTGFPTVALITAWVTAGLLLLGGWLGHLDVERADAAISLLLAGSALFAGAVASSGEHRLVQSQFALPRIALAAIALMGLAAAGALAFGLSSCIIELIWRFAAILAVVLACILSITFVRAAPATR